MLITKLLQAHSKIALDTSILAKKSILFIKSDFSTMQAVKTAVYFKQVIKHVVL